MIAMTLAQYEQTGRDWIKKLYEAQGGWRIAAEDGQLRLHLDADFTTRPGPDVKIYLSARPIVDIGNRDQVADHARFVATLAKFSGAQSFDLGDGTGFDRYRAVVLHCEAYSAVWCGVALREG
ncbi:MAG: hypothetical protein CMN19_17810 [Roseovarius sp.]|nr:hypothetical protein [Roseovarius sp.]